MKIKSYEEARKKLSEQKQAKIVNWYAETFSRIEDIPLSEINYYLEELE